MIYNDHVKKKLVSLLPIEKFKIKEVLSYETLSETEWGVQFHPNKFEILNKNNLQNKIKAFRKYKSQIKKNFHPRSINGIKNLAEFRGSNILFNLLKLFR